MDVLTQIMASAANMLGTAVRQHMSALMTDLEPHGLTVHICCTLLHMRCTCSTVLCLEDFHVIARFQPQGGAHLTDSRGRCADTAIFLLQVPGRHVPAVGAWSDS